MTISSNRTKDDRCKEYAMKMLNLFSRLLENLELFSRLWKCC